MEECASTTRKNSETEKPKNNSGHALSSRANCDSPAHTKSPQPVCKVKTHGRKARDIKPKRDRILHEFLHPRKTDFGPINGVHDPRFIDVIQNINKGEETRPPL